MKIYNIEEHGFSRAMLGLARSYNQSPEKMPSVALKLSDKDKGHNKFLESIVVWMEVEAPRFWWSEMDTYRVGMTKQSDSTMHTLTRKSLTYDNFEYGCNQEYLLFLNRRIELARKGIIKISELKNDLPDGFLQGRSICTNYKTLRHILLQRWNHKLPQWTYFCQMIIGLLEHSEYLGLPGEIKNHYMVK